MVIMKYLSVVLLLILSKYAFSESWYTEKVSKIEKENHCEVTYGDWKNPVPFVTTPNYFIAWCKKTNENRVNLIVVSSKPNTDWDKCGNFIKVNESTLNNVLYIEESAAPYEKPLPMYKFWTLESLDREFYDYLESDTSATNKTIYFGIGGILYCYNNQWVMSGYH